MPPDVRIVTRHHASSLQSLRLSCDQCRVQKLKCSVPAGCSSCVRCDRVKVACVFGRRTPSRRARASINAKARPLDDALIYPPPSPPIEPALAGTPAPGSPHQSTANPASGRTGTAAISTGRAPTPPAPAAHMDTPVSITRPSAAVELQPGSFGPEADRNDNMEMSLFDMLECDSDMIGYSWQHSDTLPEHANMYEIASLDTTPWSQLATVTPTDNWQAPPEGMTEFDGGNAAITKSSGGNDALTGRQLTALISEVQQLLQKLEEGPWHSNSAHSLDDYPVGTILKLSQQFGVVAGPLLDNTTSRTGEQLQDKPGDKDQTGKHITRDPNVDTPTMLLVMYGYMLLVHLYEVALDHFQRHLRQLPSSNQLGVMIGARNSTTSSNSNKTDTQGMSVGYAMRLGELPSAHVAMGLQKIYTAVCILLDALHEVKGQLGFEVGTARDIAVDILLGSGRHHDGSSGDLGQKAAAVKELLREKMGF